MQDLISGAMQFKHFFGSEGVRPRRLNGRIGKKNPGPRNITANKIGDDFIFHHDNFDEHNQVQYFARIVFVNQINFQEFALQNNLPSSCLFSNHGV